jgi:tetratricopeptide (TPR) repeat protein
MKRIGQCYLKLANVDTTEGAEEKFIKAEEFLISALKADEEGKDLVSRTHLLTLYVQKTRWKDVISMSKEIIAIDSSKVDVIDKMAIAYQMTGENNNAIKAWEEVIDRNPESPELANYYFNKAMIEVRISKAQAKAEGVPEEEAKQNSEKTLAAVVDDLKKVIELNPEDEEAFTFLMNSLLQLERWKELADILQPVLFPDGTVEIIDNPKDDILWWRILSAAYANSDQEDKAVVVARIMKAMEEE